MTSSELHVLSATDWDEWYGVLEGAFGGAGKGPEHREAVRGITDPGRSLAARDGKLLVGTAGSFRFDVTVPGGRSASIAGVSMVSVAATHRRRGILGSLMRRQLDDFRDAGEPLAMLTASEPAIYGRYGYGAASRFLRAEIDTARVRLGPLPDGTDAVRIRTAPPAEALTACEAVYARAVSRRPGMIARLPGWDAVQILDGDPSAPLLCVLAETDGEVTGYARYRNRAAWDASGPAGTVEVQDLHADDPASRAALWRYLFGIDLVSTLTKQSLPLDDPLLHLVSDQRRCGLRQWDGLYVRLVEAGTALTARGYTAPVDVVLEVEDEFCGWNTGRWRLSADASGAVCERTADPADLALPVRALGAAYLGGTSLTSLAAAGTVRELRPGALSAACTAFGSGPAPWYPHDF
ncbi:GNAT family N-acetyltransferase [Streptomyces qinzhouensis]|uniref:GNAT family N-acetyltransferase n=1 Tax=Streptomyces qinzhouensis TaxID=2599401 RepID=A0A5B8IHC6_9ACTN|nr:GNAT family N-acetyltransferase [Streptomyces qinzhouensis]QDY76739.1 GNAT family N-acetyltransferase [Streptomyces qinzhouensis]